MTQQVEVLQGCLRMLPRMHPEAWFPDGRGQVTGVVTGTKTEGDEEVGCGEEHAGSWSCSETWGQQV